MLTYHLCIHNSHATETPVKNGHIRVIPATRSIHVRRTTSDLTVRLDQIRRQSTSTTNLRRSTDHPRAFHSQTRRPDSPYAVAHGISRSRSFETSGSLRAVRGVFSAICDARNQARLGSKEKARTNARKRKNNGPTTHMRRKDEVGARRRKSHGAYEDTQTKEKNAR